MLRHCFASLAADLGFNEPTIASLLGHKNAQHYQQLRFRSAVLAAADALTNETLKVMGGTGFGNSVPAFSDDRHRPDHCVVACLISE
jgi:hypothetical protein